MDSAVQDLCDRITDAQRRGTALRLSGNGTKAFYGEYRDPPTSQILNLSTYRGVISYDPSELVVTARCGTPLSELEDLLSSRGQYLAFEPPGFGGDPTIGGVVAAGLSGPRRFQVGAARDFVLGAVLISADAQILKFGGQVMKNVAGFDISRLLCGSLGILGPIIEVSIKVLPLPRLEATLHFDMSVEDALEALNRWGGQPLPISASAWFDGQLWLRLSGAPSALKTARERLGGQLLSETAGVQWWQSLRHQTHPFFQQTQSLWRLSVPSTAALTTLPGPSLIEWGGALRWCATNLSVAEMRQYAADAGGTATHWKGGADGQRMHPLAPAVYELHRRLKLQFDPKGIFNPGRLLAGL
jgi:glycolate oxidase FAD binding subunit